MSMVPVKCSAGTGRNQILSAGLLLFSVNDGIILVIIKWQDILTRFFKRNKTVLVSMTHIITNIDGKNVLLKFMEHKQT